MDTRKAALATTLAIASAAAVTIPAVAHADPGQIELEARMHGSSHYPHARGFSEYERGGGEREVSVTVRAPGAAHRYVAVFVNRQWVGRIHLNKNGYGHREWETTHGQNVPYASGGDPVRVRRVSNQVLVISGWYHRVAD